MPLISNARTPPIRAKGMLQMMISASLKDLKASKSSTKMSRMDSGTTSIRRFMARSWFSNSPDQVME